MKKFGSFGLLLWSVFSPINLNAFPSSLYWTTCNTYVLPTGVGNFQVSNYFTVFHKNQQQSVISPNAALTDTFPPDVGLTVGIFTWNDWEAELGIDYLGGFDYPWFFNGKIGIKENKLFSNSPGFSIGIYDIGTRAGITDFNIVDAVIGKTLPSFLSGGSLFFGTFIGTRTLGRDQIGYMFGYAKVFCPRKDCYGNDYWKLWLVADYASGKNFIGGGGIGITYFFTSKAFLVTGPTWFNDSQFNGRWKWTVQLEILFSAFKSSRYIKCKSTL